MEVIRIVSELDFGGVEQVMANTIPAISQIEEIDVKVLVLGKGGKVTEELKSKGISVEVWNQNPRIPNIRILWKLRSFLKKEKPYVIHCQGSEANFHGLLAGFLAQIPCRIAEEIGMPNHHSFWRYIFRIVYSFATTVIVVAQNVGNRIIELKEVSPKIVQVLYNPVGLVDSLLINKAQASNVIVNFDKDGLSEIFENNEVLENLLPINRDQNVWKQPFVFITTCRLVPIKNLDRLISAFSALVKEDGEKLMELWIVGDGPIKEELIQLASGIGLDGKVKFWGFQKNIFGLLQQSDVFILPSLSEGSPVSLAEAMLIGLPSIVTEVGGGPEILGDSESGILINPLDTAAIFEAMKKLLNLSKEERIEMGIRAKEEAGRFKMETYISNLLQIYHLELK
ncbi:MAG: glycosyltransferase [Cyclobacteriaceae bacterium]